MSDPLDLLICTTCGVQYSETDQAQRQTCPVCDDPRQYVAADGQSWTTLKTMQQSGNYKNDFQVVDEANLSSKNCQLISIHTTPQVAIGQRAFLCLSPKGNILWDCITYLDDDTVATIQGYGGVSAIVISHPHYYSTCLHWARALNCKVYLSVEDEEWVMRKPASSPSEEGEMELWAGQRMSLGQDGEFLCVKTGGHFPGSSVLSWPRVGKLLVADTIQVVPSGIYHVDRPKGTVSFTFMWSYPNFIPLPPDEVLAIWDAVKDLQFEDTHGAFMGKETYGKSRERMLESAKIIVKAMGYTDHRILGINA